MHRKVSVVFSRNYCLKMTDFSRLGPLQAVMHPEKSGSVKETVQDRMLLLHITSRNLGSSNDLSIRAISNDFWMILKVIRLLQDLSNATRLIFVRNFARFQTFNWHGASRGPSAIAKLLVLFDFKMHAPVKLPTYFRY